MPDYHRTVNTLRSYPAYQTHFTLFIFTLEKIYIQMRSIARYIPAILFLHCKHGGKKHMISRHITKLLKSDRNKSGIKILKMAEPQKANL